MIVVQTMPAKTKFRLLKDVEAWAAHHGLKHYRRRGCVYVEYEDEQADDLADGTEVLKYSVARRRPTRRRAAK